MKGSVLFDCFCLLFLFTCLLVVCLLLTCSLADVGELCVATEVLLDGPPSSCELDTVVLWGVGGLKADRVVGVSGNR